MSFFLPEVYHDNGLVERAIFRYPEGAIEKNYLNALLEGKKDAYVQANDTNPEAGDCP
jgi:hypothetical protein